MRSLEQSPARPASILRVQSLAFVCAILLALPFLNAPLLQDDVVHRVMLLDKTRDLHWSPLDLYDFIGAPRRTAPLLRDRGFLPWFAADDLKLRFFRPLSSGVLAADARTFGERVWASRLHSLAWFLAILAGVGAVHRRFLSPPSAALGTLIYAVAAGHTMPVGWIAARSSLLCSAFALLSFWLYVRERQDGWWPGRWLALLAFACGLLAGEMGLGALALIAAWEVLGRHEPRRRRIVAVVPFVGMTVIYLAAYIAMGYGVRGTGGYIGFTSGVAGAAGAVRHFLILMGELTAATPSDAVGTASATAQTLAAVWGLLMTLVVWAAFRLSRTHADHRDTSAMRWLPAAAAAAALPGVFALVGGRVLTLALVPASGVVAIVIVAGVSVMVRGRRRFRQRLLVIVPTVGLVIGHLFAAPVIRIAMAKLLTRLAVEQHDLAALAPECKGEMVLAVAADPTVATYVPATLAFRNRGPEHVRVLSMAPRDHRIENVTTSGFDLVTLGGARIRTVWEQLYGSHPMASGTRVTLSSLTAQVIEEQDGIPVRVRFDFGDPLDSGRLCFFQWRDSRLAQFTPPKPHQVVDLPHHPGPMGW
jgi:hypothetical protein